MAAQHCMERMGVGKLYFPLLKSGKRQKAPLGPGVTTHFVADCSCTLARYEFISTSCLM